MYGVFSSEFESLYTHTQKGYQKEEMKTGITKREVGNT